MTFGFIAFNHVARRSTQSGASGASHPGGEIPGVKP